MSAPATVREALIVEAVGEVARLIQSVEALAPLLNECCRALEQASTRLRDELSGLERRTAAIAESAKSQTVKYIVARAGDAAARSIDAQSRAIAEAARVAFGTEVGAIIQWLHTTLQPLLERRERRWTRCLTHAAAALAGAAATWTWTLCVGLR
jgi:hypothetical protein